MAFNLHRRVSVSTHSTPMTRDFSAQASELSLAIAKRFVPLVSLCRYMIERSELHDDECPLWG